MADPQRDTSSWGYEDVPEEFNAFDVTAEAMDHSCYALQEERQPHRNPRCPSPSRDHSSLVSEAAASTAVSSRRHKRRRASPSTSAEHSPTPYASAVPATPHTTTSLHEETPSQSKPSQRKAEGTTRCRRDKASRELEMEGSDAGDAEHMSDPFPHHKEEKGSEELDIDYPPVLSVEYLKQSPFAHLVRVMEETEASSLKDPSSAPLAAFLRHTSVMHLVANAKISMRGAPQHHMDDRPATSATSSTTPPLLDLGHLGSVIRTADFHPGVKERRRGHKGMVRTTPQPRASSFSAQSSSMHRLSICLIPPDTEDGSTSLPVSASQGNTTPSGTDGATTPTRESLSGAPVLLLRPSGSMTISGARTVAEARAAAQLGLRLIQLAPPPPSPSAWQSMHPEWMHFRTNPSPTSHWTENDSRFCDSLYLHQFRVSTIHAIVRLQCWIRLDNLLNEPLYDLSKPFSHTSSTEERGDARPGDGDPDRAHLGYDGLNDEDHFFTEDEHSALWDVHSCTYGMARHLHTADDRAQREDDWGDPWDASLDCGDEESEDNLNDWGAEGVGGFDDGEVFYDDADQEYRQEGSNPLKRRNFKGKSPSYGQQHPSLKTASHVLGPRCPCKLPGVRYCLMERDELHHSVVRVLLVGKGYRQDGIERSVLPSHSEMLSSSSCAGWMVLCRVGVRGTIRLDGARNEAEVLHALHALLPLLSRHTAGSWV